MRQCFLAVLFVLSGSAVPAQYAIDWHMIGGGGGTSAGGVYSVSGTIGQPAAGKMSGSSYTIDGGFWETITAFQIRELNTPFLNPPADISINELTPYTASAAATESSVLPNPLDFALVSGPRGLAVSRSGAINWTPDETQGPSTNLVTISVADANSLSATNTYSIIVNEVNTAPELAVTAMQTVCELDTLIVTNMATDADLPSNQLTFTMVSGPTGAVLDASSGLFTWSPTEEYASTTNIIIVRVTDNGVPAASDTKAFAVAVVVRPRLLDISESSDGKFTLEWQVQSGRAYRMQFNDSLSGTNWTTLGVDHTASGSPLSIIDDAGAARHGFYRLLDVTSP